MNECGTVSGTRIGAGNGSSGAKFTPVPFFTTINPI
jgi:hypothetical protein